MSSNDISILPTKVKQINSPQLIKLKIVPQLVSQLQIMLKDLDINLVKNDPVIIEFILTKIKETSQYLQKVKISKEEFCSISLQVIKGLIPSITKAELDIVEKIIQFLENNNLAKIKKTSIQKCLQVASTIYSKISS